MATIDLSRSATDYRKHYKSVRAQQGRVFVDDDHNENERIHGEDLRAETVEVIGPVGAPGDGFLISNPRVTGGNVDFDLAAGSLYVGGNRLKLDSPTTFQTQPDWLQIFGGGVVSAPAAARNDLVYVETCQVPVASVEDSETFEVALGGPDTSTRMRQLQRVHVLEGIAGADCADGWAQLLQTLHSGAEGTLNSENELVPDTQLKVQFANNGTSTDLCSPPVAGGYLGAENQAIRVQLVDASHFTWGFDNASPLYRVNVNVQNGLLTQVTMLTEPKDQAHWPTAGQVVEFLAWSAVLPNNEKTAEITGFLTRVASSYDPDQKQFTIDPANPLAATFGTDWKQRSDAGTLAPAASDLFFYIRVWNRGGDTTSPVSIPFAAAPVDLLGTGLQVVFSGNDRPVGDFWIIAARPDSPDLVVPWSLQSGKGPNGYRRFFAPLGVISWSTTAAGGVTGSVTDDCRRPFLPLTRLGGCCTFSVGDGQTSFGKFTSIQAAIQAMPAAGGEICILPGTYTENFTVNQKQHIRIHGCGARTILTPKDRTAAVATIQDSQFISIVDLTIESDMSSAVVIVSSLPAIAQGGGADHIALRRLDLEVRDASAIACFFATNVAIAENLIHVKALAASVSNNSQAGLNAAIFLMGETVEIVRNRIVADGGSGITTGVGGVQLFGLSTAVRIERNHIEGGNGNGITLGAVFLLSSNVDPTTGLGNGWKIPQFPVIWIDPGGCVHGGGGTPPGDPNNPRTPVAWGLFLDILILDNDILNMGLSGIASPDLPTGTTGVPIVEFLEIGHNRITGCAQLTRSNDAAKSTTGLPGRGGIALDVAGYASIRDNWIAGNGPSFVSSICGIWIGMGGGLVIERNQILNNGAAIQTQQPFEAGPRAGIRVELAATAVAAVASNAETEYPALRVAGNIVVSPSGPALAAIADGPVMIAGNELTGGVVAAPGVAIWTLDAFSALLGGYAVLVVNTGTLSEITSTQVDFATLAQHQNGLVSATTTNSTNPDFVSGDILFDGNRVLLNYPDRGDSILISSVALFALADISAQSNQLTARTGNHPLATNALALGFTLRFEGNRCQDRFDNGFSGVTFALMNATANNQGTRCFQVTSPVATLLVNTGNRSWFDLTQSQTGGCADLNKATAAAFAKAGSTSKQQG